MDLKERILCALFYKWRDVKKFISVFSAILLIIISVAIFFMATKIYLFFSNRPRG